MLKQGLQQKLQQKMSPLQIQTIKLLELPLLELEQKIQKDSTPSYKLYVNNQGKDLKPEYNTFSVKESFQQSLINQLGYKHLSEREWQIPRPMRSTLDPDTKLFRPTTSV